MLVGIFKDEDEVARVAADLIINTFTVTPEGVLGVATGSTPLPMYKKLREAHAQGRFDLSKNHAFALDEYVGLPAGHPESYRQVLTTELVGDDKTGLKDENLHTPNGQASDLTEAAIAYDDEIMKHGVDLQILGIGADGHIGFNEPGGSLDSRTHIGALTRQTREDNARFFDSIDQVPTKCLTQGIGTIMDAGAVMLLATGAAKADAVAELVEGGISARWPASMLQLHQDAYVFVDEAAASKLELADFYRENWELLKPEF